MDKLMQGGMALAGRVCLVMIFLMSALMEKIPSFDTVAGVMAGEGMPVPKVMLAGGIAFMVLGSLSLLLGFKVRVGAAMLALFLVLANYYFHDFWAFEDAQAKEQQMIAFMKNTAIFGAMLFVMANGAGVWSLDQAMKNGKSTAKQESKKAQPAGTP